MKTKYYRNRFGGFGIAEANSTLTGDAVDLACCHTEKQARELVTKLNSHDDLLRIAQDLLKMVDEMLPKAGPCGWGTLATDDAREVIARATGNTIPTPAVSENLNQPL